MTNKVLPVVILVFLASAGLVLAVLQYRWIDQVSRSEEERIGREMRINLVQALSNAGDEARMIVSLFQPTGLPHQTMEENIQSIEKNIAYWNGVTLFPDLLADGYVVSYPGSGPSFRLEDGQFVASPLPESLRSAFHAAISEQQKGETRTSFNRLHEEGFIVIPYGQARGFWFGDGGTMEDMENGRNTSHGPSFFVFCRIDQSVLLEKVIPYYLSVYLETYPFVIAQPGGGPIVFSSGFTGDAETARKPDIEAVIKNPFTLGGPGVLFKTDDTNSTRESFRTDDRQKSGLTDRRNLLLKFLTSRFLGTGTMRIMQERSEPLALVSLYYPKKPLGEIITARKTANLAVSFGIVAVLLVSALVMFRLYTKTGELRVREQEFVASMSHELRTPISVIQSASQNLADGVVGEKAKIEAYGRLIEEHALRLSRMVEGILSFSGLTAGKRSGTEPVDIISLARTVVDYLRPSAERAGGTIGISFEQAPDRIKTDHAAFRLILENLLLNALRHGLPPDHGGDGDRDGGRKTEFRYRGEPIKLAIFCSETGTCTVTVEDHGEGIPSKEADKVFDLFVRGEQAVKEQREGTGLGLHLVKRVVTLLGGSVTLESPYKNKFGMQVSGCRFTVVLPVEEGSIS